MVERNLAKVEVAGSSPVIRLKQYRKVLLFVLLFLYFVGGESGVQPDFLISNLAFGFYFSPAGGGGVFHEAFVGDLCP